MRYSTFFFYAELSRNWIMKAIHIFESCRADLQTQMHKCLNNYMFKDKHYPDLTGTGLHCLS